jgi:HlyD family secretion protein
MSESPPPMALKDRLLAWSTRMLKAAPVEGEVAPEKSYSGDLDIRRLVMAGGGIVVGFFVILGGWAGCAPLESAAIAPGVVSVDTNRKTIQHLEGGIVKTIHVRDGDVVRKGQDLVTLDSTKAEATLDLVRGRRLAGLALEARLIAERDGNPEIAFPSVLLSALDRPQVAEAVAGQRKIFSTRREALARQVAVLKQRSAQSREEIRGLKGEITSEERQLELLNGEIRDVEWLVKQGLARKPRLLELQRREAEIQGSRARNIAAIARAEQAITEAELRVAELRTSQLNEVAQALRQAQTDLFDLNEQTRAAEDVLKRIAIIAPEAGTVVGLQIHTSGGVIAPGGKVMDIVPLGDKLIVDARVDPGDIDVVRPGLEARVRLTAYQQRNFVPLKGVVDSVSADRFTDEKTGIPYFRARVAITEDPVKVMKVSPLYPGMQAEVLIVTGSRTMLEYIFQPLFQSFNRAFRET